MPCRIVVLSDRPKCVSGAEVSAGLPSSNPLSLPFAHRKLFAENVDKFDVFIYTEDDTLFTLANVKAFLEVQNYLAEDEIAGFLRSETSPAGRHYITSIHHHFRWLPESVQQRGSEVFAELSNHHSGCYIATRKQIKAAIASGGFLVSPHAETYGMLETAASDIHRQCGLKRLICISRIRDFVVPHLPNKYFPDMGIPVEQLELQIRALKEVHRSGGWRGSLFEPSTRLPGFRCSKNLYDKPDQTLIRRLPRCAKTVLSIGASSGELEEHLTKLGVCVKAIAVDSVFARTLRERGLDALEGPLEEAVKALRSKHFDAILMWDILHLADDPVKWLQTVRSLLGQGGRVIARVDKTVEMWSWLKDVYDGNGHSPLPTHHRTGVHAISKRRLRQWCEATNLEVLELLPVIESPNRRRLGWLASGPIEALLASRFVLTATVAS
jgi:2-polyprenyl-3-methyl-5-hydroxy-6-metoxy-1,4-benzoquinol methylase